MHSKIPDMIGVKPAAVPEVKLDPKAVVVPCKQSVPNCEQRVIVHMPDLANTLYLQATDRSHPCGMSVGRPPSATLPLRVDQKKQYVKFLKNEPKRKRISQGRSHRQLGTPLRILVEFFDAVMPCIASNKR